MGWAGSQASRPAASTFQAPCSLHWLLWGHTRGEGTSPRSPSIAEPSATAPQQAQRCLPALWVQGWLGGRRRATQSRHHQADTPKEGEAGKQEARPDPEVGLNKGILPLFLLTFDLCGFQQTGLGPQTEPSVFQMETGCAWRSSGHRTVSRGGEDRAQSQTGRPVLAPRASVSPPLKELKARRKERGGAGGRGSGGLRREAGELSTAHSARQRCCGAWDTRRSRRSALGAARPRSRHG